MSLQAEKVSFHVPPPRDPNIFRNSILVNPLKVFDPYPLPVQILGSSIFSSILVGSIAGAWSKAYWTGQKFPRNIVKTLVSGHVHRYALVGGLFGCIQRTLESAHEGRNILDYTVAGVLSGVFSGVYLGRPYLMAGHGFWFGLFTTAWFMLQEDYANNASLFGDLNSWKVKV
jgi:hypothetical protein